MNLPVNRTAAGCAALLTLCAWVSNAEDISTRQVIEIVGRPALFAPGVVSTEASEVRLTVSPDGKRAAWFARNRPGGAGSYDIWTSTYVAGGWSAATPVPFNSAHRDFDPAFSADGRFLYFCSDRPGGMGGDDLYRAPVTSSGFGEPQHLGAQVNSAGNEWAPMLSGDAHVLLFSSDGHAGARRFDLFSARQLASGSFTSASPLPGDINTAADEFDATFLADGTTVVFARAPNLQTDRVVLFAASLRDGRYDVGAVLPALVNAPGQSTYGPMLDWSRPDQLTISSQRPEARAGSTDLYLLRYRIVGEK
jgi:Tol biopolymer transport system component